jgi:hypothetical protein
MFGRLFESSSILKLIERAFQFTGAHSAQNKNCTGMMEMMIKSEILVIKEQKNVFRR